MAYNVKYKKSKIMGLAILWILVIILLVIGAVGVLSD